MTEQLVLAGIAVLAASGVPGLFLGRRSSVGQTFSAILFVAGAALGLAGVCVYWAGGSHAAIEWRWSMPIGNVRVAVDGLSAFFLVPVLLVPAISTVYSLGYWPNADHPENGRQLSLFYGLSTAAMALVLLSAHAIIFLAAWEIMAISSFFLVAAEDRDPAVRDVSFVYLVAAHASTLLLFALFSLLYGVTGSFDLVPLAKGSVTPPVANAIFLLALLGFGVKAGIMPMHVWLPGAHALAPSHVSALFSAVLIKMGIYGIVRTLALLPDPPAWWGGTVLAVGTVSGVLGVAFAIGQHDLKRLLAYHSVENIGIIVMGLGVALLGRSYEEPAWVALGLAGCLLHVWNHSLFKSLLFLGAGSVLHATHTREIDDLGGLAKKMPITSTCFLIGAVAICGLPPLNGFVSELFVYLGLFRTLGSAGRGAIAAVLAAPLLAMIGALALACFVKAYGAVFLGTARTQAAEDVHEAPASMWLPMGVLAACCFVIGLLPMTTVPMLTKALHAFAPASAEQAESLGSLAPLTAVSIIGLALVLSAGACGLWLSRTWTAEARQTSTWGCGYAGSSPRVQYTSASFAQMLVDLFGVFLRPKSHLQRPSGFLTGPSHFESHVDDTVLDAAVIPAFRGTATLFGWLRILQQGRVEIYLLYIIATLIALLLLT